MRPTVKRSTFFTTRLFFPAMLALLLCGSMAWGQSPTTAPADGAWFRPFFDKLQLGGWTVAVQLALSFVGMVFVVERLISLRRSNIAPRGLAEEVDALWAHGR